MKAKVIAVEPVTFSNGNQMHKAFAQLESGIIGTFFAKEVAVGELYELHIATDSNSKFVVRRQKISEK